MERTGLITILVFALVHRSFAFEINQCTGPQAGMIQTLTNDQATLLNSCSYDTCPAGQLYCGTGTNCLPVANWCGGTTNTAADCPNDEDEGTAAGKYCEAATVCTGCAALISATDLGTGRHCKPVFWTPPTSTTNAVIADCNHFPGTTFPSATGSATTTEVVYAVDLNDAAPHRYCVFEVQIPAGACDPVVNNCPNTAQIKTANVDETTAIVTWTEITTDASATVAIDNESHRPGSSFPLGYTRVEYTITKTADTTMKSYCIFYVHVKANTATSSTLNCDMLMPISKIITPPAESSSVQTELEAQLNQLPSGVTYTLTVETTSHVFSRGTNAIHVVLTNGDETLTCPSTITIAYKPDTANPVITGCPTSPVGVCYRTGATVTAGSWTEPTATDDVAVKSFTSDIEPGTLLTIPGASDPPITVTYTAVDYEDKTSICTFELNFEVDTKAPTQKAGTCVDFTEYTTATTNTIAVNFVEPQFEDDCVGEQLNIVRTKNPGDTFAVPSTTPVTYTATDKAENTPAATCTFNVIVAVDMPPTRTNCPSPFVVATVTGQTYGGPVEWTAPTFADDNRFDRANIKLTMVDSQNTAVPNLNAQDAMVSIPQLASGTYTVTYMYTDVNLQSSTCVFQVTVKDQSAPTFNNCPQNIETDLIAGQSSKQVTWPTPITATDSPPSNVNVVLTTGQDSGSSFQSGQYTITYTATDAAGNTAACTFTITVNAYNTQNFYMNCPTNIPSQNTEPGKPTGVVTWTAPTIRSDVTSPRETINFQPGSSFPIGTTSVEYRVVDAAGNQGVCQFAVTVVDNEAPTIFNCPAPVTAYGRTGTGAPVYWEGPTTTDNSGGVVTLSASPFGSGSVFTYGNHQIVYTAADPSGNQATSCTTSVTVSRASDPDAVTGTAEFLSIRGRGGTDAVSQSQNLADDIESLFRQNTPVSSDVADVTVGTPSVLSSGRLFVPYTIYLQHCRASYTAIRDSLTLDLGGTNEDTFATNNVIVPSSFTLNTKEFLLSNFKVARDLNRASADQELIYTTDLRDPSSAAYQQLEDRICDAMDNVYPGFAEFCGCDIIEFRAGSVIADLVLIFGRNTPVSDTALLNQLQNSITNGQIQNLVLEDTGSLRVTEVCPSGYCQNGGTCQPNPASYTSQCTCAPNYSGTQCQTFTGTPTTTQAPSGGGSGLSTEEIIGIVVGAVGGLLLFIILCACCCIFCMGPSEPKRVPIIQEPPEPIIAVSNPRPPVLIRDVVGPRPPVPMVGPRPPIPTPVPVPRPYPVRVPIPTAVPCPTPVRVPVPTPVPFPVPTPYRQPVRVQQPVPFAVRQPFPVPTPVRVPVNVGVPIRNPSGLGTGFNTGANALALNGGMNTGLNTGFNMFNSTGF